MNKNTVEEIQKPIANEMMLFEDKFKASMKSDVFLLDKITNYIVKRKGKQIRPMFVFLFAKMLGNVEDKTFRGAILIELLHTATLVHDDVVDESDYRRGFFSLNALWKNKIPVLVGDFLLARGLLLAVENTDFDLLKIVSKAVKLMSEGELLQIEKARRLDITEEVYFEIIKNKTASLISSCCSVGAASITNDTEIIQKALLFGEKVGIAFQIKDDLFDYGNDDIGKPLGIDIKEKKMTLPLIYALNKATWLEKKKIIYIVKYQSHKKSKVEEVINFVKKSGGIEHTEKVMKKYTQEAMEILHQFEENEARNALELLVKFTVERKK
ncbi:MAG: polyprenyl synthetase family protein [Cytophagales bacterium]